ncbi:MAG: autotransporter-associated beta strand repeat-containing protein, partial [Verrucomicrobiota bacterium]
GTLALSGNNTYEGSTTITEGVLSVFNLAVGGKASGIGKSSSAASNLVFDGGTLQYTNGEYFENYIDRSFTISPGKIAAFDIATVWPNAHLVMTGSVPSTTGGLSKSGVGVLVLGGPNFYTGPTIVTEGILMAGSSVLPFGIASETVLSANGTLSLLNNTNTSSDPVSYNVTIGSLTGEAGSSVVLGTGTLTTGSSNNATFGGVISGAGGITKVGAGIETLTGNNTYTGSTQIRGGGLTLSGGSIAASSSISISNNATLAIVNYGGTTDAINATASVTMSGGTLSFQTLAFERVDYSETIGNLTVTGGYNTIQNGQAMLGSTSTLTINSLARTGNAIVNFSGENLGLGVRNRILFTTAPTLGEWALYNGVGYAAYDATNGIVEAAYDNVTRLSSGPKVIYSAPQGNTRVIDGTGTPGVIALNDATTTIFTLTQAATGGVSTIDTAGKTFALSSMLVGTGASGLTIGTAPNSGNLTSPSAALTLVNYSTNNLLVNSTVVGSIDVKMSGTGTAVLAGNNTYTGVTTLEQGILSVATIGNGGVAGNLGAAGNATANIVFTGGTLLYTGADTTTDRGFTVMSNGSRFETSANFQFSGAGIALASGSITIGGAGNTTITSIISGAGALAKDGASTLTLQGSNTFTGGVTLSGGFVSVTS